MLPELAIDCAREADHVAAFIADFVEQRRADGIVLGLSGGIDSAVVAALSARSLSAQRVTALFLPERDSSPDSASDAKLLAEQLQIPFEVRDLTPALEALGCYRTKASSAVRLRQIARGAVRLFPGAARKGYLASLRGGELKEFQEFVAFYRMKHRARLVAICREAEERNLVVASCANRTEFETGFFVRYGDDSGDVAPIKHLYKMQVFQLGRHLGMPERILKKAPSPDLFAGVKDEEILGMSYEHLDGILFGIARGSADDRVAADAGVEISAVRYVKDIMRESQRLRDPPASLLPRKIP
jgi:NAD+ synthase